MLSSCQSGYTPRANDTVTVDCIECKHPKMSWRALKVCPINFPISNKLVVFYEALVFLKIPFKNLVQLNNHLLLD